jgi:hypothetical protein
LSQSKEEHCQPDPSDQAGNVDDSNGPSDRSFAMIAQAVTLSPEHNKGVG